VVLFVDNQVCIRGGVMIAQGGRGFVATTVAEVLRPALIAGASAIIIGHNHPSSGIEPTEDDDDMTDRVLLGAAAVGVPLLDHIIVTENPDAGFFSYANKWAEEAEAKG
jgi:DNA repair protein RadC